MAVCGTVPASNAAALLYAGTAPRFAPWAAAVCGTVPASNAAALLYAGTQCDVREPMPSIVTVTSVPGRR